MHDDIYVFMLIHRQNVVVALTSLTSLGNNTNDSYDAILIKVNTFQIEIDDVK
jgi:hypothetical protein